MKLFKTRIALVLCGCLMFTGIEQAAAFQSDPSTAQPPQAALQSARQLEQLVAPIALYPDALIAQILPAATYPDEVLDAAKWMEQHQDLTGGNRAKEVDKQSWDPSVKALTQFPSVLANMKQTLAWTSELGDAYVNQQQELSSAIQTMRDKAKKAGNLNTTAQQKVSTKGKNIVIEPAAPEVVYVPQYDPWLVYGDPLAVFPGWYPYPGLFLDGPGIGFGLGFGIGLFADFGWGWHNWGFDWGHRGRIVFNHNVYISHSRTIVNRGGFGHPSFRGSQDFHGGGFRPSDFRPPEGMRSGAFSGFSHGGIARDNAFRGASSFGGFRGGGGFHGGGRR